MDDGLQSSHESGTEAWLDSLFHNPIIVTVDGVERALKPKGFIYVCLGKLGIGPVDVFQCLGRREAELTGSHPNHVSILLVQIMDGDAALALKIDQKHPHSRELC